MSRPPLAKEKIVDAYAALLCDEGERAATIEATAARAGVSKGGLLYHFASKEALAQGVIDGLLQVQAEDLERMGSAPEGASRYFVRTSTLIGTELDRFFLAVLRLAQSGHEPSIKTLDAVHSGWLDLIRAEVQDRYVAETIMLIGEGLYYQTSMPGPWSQGTFAKDLEHLLDQVERLKNGG
ncbi:TetR/AcrR family transcriptional regulator [Paeniglutamicibacter sp. ABSL32-1]|uniref:TetR/AcrR family transcriptional regulator n=1 Tax=Paeniglutamicibacter quisquiliarum TaxID=2849498 RepID=UPI001C2CF1E9|nr:TetR/AcrR family transcriptional regulator [Paeniglutamicibacter quisquiliarum]MBV1778138.1 TetR/AcrR family transcriptional regulator [Paeniglutamicibacter quisquiliarum]